MRLCDRDIEAWLDEGRLAINPRPPVERINGATVDVRLGNKFRTFRGHTAPFIDLSGPKAEVSAALDRVMSEEIVLPEGEAFFLHPGELALAVTYESVTLPADLVGWLDGRSSLARLGLMVHVTAHRIDPGWSGCIVLEFYNSGMFYSQEPSASSAAPLLGVQPGMRVLDLCAAPGGKSSQLAAALQGRGVLVSNEYVAARAEILKSNLERMGVPNAVVLNETPARIAEALPEFFDRVLVDFYL